MDYTQTAKELLMLLWSLRHIMRSSFATEEVKGENVVLLYLREHENAATPGQISEALSVTMPRMTALLNSLEDKGYVSRAHTLHDRRKAKVALTSEGHKALENILGAMISNTTDILEYLGAGDAEACMRIMKKLARYDSAG